MPKVSPATDVILARWEKARAMMPLHESATAATVDRPPRDFARQIRAVKGTTSNIWHVLKLIDDIIRCVNDKRQRQRLLVPCLLLLETSTDGAAPTKVWASIPSKAQVSALVCSAVAEVMLSRMASADQEITAAACCSGIARASIIHEAIASQMLIDILWLLGDVNGPQSLILEIIGDLMKVPVLQRVACAILSLTHTGFQAAITSGGRDVKTSGLAVRQHHACVILANNGIKCAQQALKHVATDNIWGGTSQSDLVDRWHPWKGLPRLQHVEKRQAVFLSDLVSYLCKQQAEWASAALQTVALRLTALSSGLQPERCIESTAGPGSLLVPAPGTESQVRQQSYASRNMLDSLLDALLEHLQALDAENLGSLPVAVGSIATAVATVTSTLIVTAKQMWTQTQTIKVACMLGKSFQLAEFCDLSSGGEEALARAAKCFLAAIEAAPQSVFISTKGEQLQTAQQTSFVQDFNSAHKSLSQQEGLAQKQYIQVCGILELAVRSESLSLGDLSQTAASFMGSQDSHGMELPRDAVRRQAACACIAASQAILLAEEPYESDAAEIDVSVSVLERVAGEMCVFADCSHDISALCNRRICDAAGLLVLLQQYAGASTGCSDSLVRRIADGISAEYDSLPDRRAMLARIAWMMVARATIEYIHLLPEQLEAIQSSAGGWSVASTKKAGVSMDEDVAALASCAACITGQITVHTWSPAPTDTVSTVLSWLATCSWKSCTQVMQLAMLSGQVSGIIETDLLGVVTAASYLADERRDSSESAPALVRGAPSLLRALMEASYSKLKLHVHCDPLVMAQLWAAAVTACAISTETDASSPIRLLIGHEAVRCAVKHAKRDAVDELSSTRSIGAASSSDSSCSTGKQGDAGVAGQLEAETSAALQSETESTLSKSLVTRCFPAIGASQKHISASSLQSCLGRSYRESYSGRIQTEHAQEHLTILNLVCATMGRIKAAELRSDVFCTVAMVGLGCMGHDNIGSRPALVVLAGALAQSAGEPETPLILLKDALQRLCSGESFSRLAKSSGEALFASLRDITDAVVPIEAKKVDLVQQWRALAASRQSLGATGSLLLAIPLGMPASEARALARRRSLGVRELSTAEQSAAGAVFEASQRWLEDGPNRRCVEAVATAGSGSGQPEPWMRNVRRLLAAEIARLPERHAVVPDSALGSLRSSIAGAAAEQDAVSDSSSGIKVGAGDTAADGGGAVDSASLASSDRYMGSVASDLQQLMEHNPNALSDFAPHDGES